MTIAIVNPTVSAAAIWAPVDPLLGVSFKPKVFIAMSPVPPELPVVDDEKYIKEAIVYVNKNFSKNYGNTDNFLFPMCLNSQATFI